MQMYEVKAVLENLQHKNKTGWEQARMISYIIAQTNSTKQLSPTDIMKFDWDEAKEKDTRNNSMPASVGCECLHGR